MGVGLARGLTKSAYDIIIIIKENQNQAISPKNIAYSLHKSEQATNNILRRLLKKGLVENHNRGIFTEYTLTPAGLNAYQRVLSVTTKRVLPTTNLNTSGVYVRLHALAIKVKLKTPYSSDELPKLLSSLSLSFKPKPMQGHTDQIFQFNGITFKLTPSSIIAYSKQAVAPLEQQIPAMTEQAIKETIDTLYAFEMQMQGKDSYFKLMRKTKTIDNQKDYDYSIPELHIAITNDEFAKQATAERDPYLIAMSEIDSDKESLIADKSIKIGTGNDKKGIPEVEGISKEMLPNKQPEAVFNTENIRRFYEAIGKAYYDPFEQQAKLAETLEVLRKTADNQFTHIPLIQQAKDTLQANNELMATFMPIIKDYLAKQPSQAQAASSPKGIIRRIWQRLW